MEGQSGENREKVVLGLVGSPRKLGNCEVITKEISRRLPPAHTLTLLRIPSLDIRPCRACYGCVLDRPCPNRDDMDFLLDQLARADAFIITSPVYFLNAHSMYRRILDRGFLFYRVLKETHGKPCVLVNLYGMNDRMGAASHTLMSFAAFLGLEVKARVNVKAALPGEVLLRKSTEATADRLAISLFSNRPAPHGHGCPFCGCDIVRLRGKDMVCTLCHGTFTRDEAGKTTRRKEGGIFGTADHMLLHKKWLSGMKGEFLKSRREILKTTLPYKNKGEWIEPPSAPDDSDT